MLHVNLVKTIVCVFFFKVEIIHLALVGPVPRSRGTTANEGTRGSLVRMTPDVVYYSWAAIYTSI